jgi:uncharacterized protein
MAAYSFLDLAYEVLKKSPTPLTYQEIWQQGKLASLTDSIRTSGKTPWDSMGSQLYIEVRNNEHPRFIKVGKRPARFFLKEREKELSDEIITLIEKEEQKTKGGTTKYHERDLHPLLTYFVSANPSFNRGRAIFTKTIFHEKSQKAGYNEWIHPDIVGFYLPIEDWKAEVIEFNRLSDNNSLRLFSFELKKYLNKSNYREAYFQAVSNSSWAHEGYLVAANILQDDAFLSELDRLASSFGIGIINLDPADIDASAILYPARRRETLDWETINKLCEQNRDFEKFLRDVKIDFESKRLHKSEYEEVNKEIKGYIRSKLNIDVPE